MVGTDWDKPDSRKTKQGLRNLLRVCDEFERLIQELVSRPPPLALLAVHRQTTRSVAALGDAVVEFVLLLAAPTLPDAYRGQERGQDRLDLAADRASHVSSSLERAARTLTTPGFWSIGDEYDTGRVAWEGIDTHVTTIVEAADIVRRTFAEVPGIQELADEQAFMLMPAAAVGASLQDPERLTARAVAARRLLDEADARKPDWVDDVEVLVEQIWTGHRQLIDQVVRLGHDIRSDAPRRILMQTGLDVYSKFYEGPFRRLGGTVALAARVLSEADVRFDAAAAGSLKPANVAKGLSEAAPTVVEGILQPLRHAEAHYDFDLDDEGVTVRFHATRQAPASEEWLSDEDFFEELINLNEALVALELAVIPWLVSSDHPAIQADLERRGRERRPVRETLRAVAGIKGWTDLRLDVDGETLVIHGVYRGPEGEDRSLGLLPVAAAAWSSFPEVRRIDLEPALGVAFTLSREQFPGPTIPELRKLHLTADLISQVLEATQQDSPVAVHARWRAMPVLLLPARAAADLLADPNEETAQNLADYLRWAISFIETNQGIAEEPAALIQEAVPLLKKLRRAIDVWVMAPTEPGRLAIRARDDVRRTARRLFELASRCRSLTG